jgi:two-component system, LytTR family, response regulator
MPINAMITEDDLLSRTILCDLLEDYFPDVHIVGMAQTVKESVEFLKDHKIDLLFLDIELPDGKGPDILRSAPECGFHSDHHHLIC